MNDGVERIDQYFFDRYQEALRLSHVYAVGNEGFSDRVALANAYNDMVLGLSRWKSFITLTFRQPVEADVAWKKVRVLISKLNIHKFGINYRRKVGGKRRRSVGEERGMRDGHSYFSYCIGMEYQTREVVHFHMLVDRNIDFTLLHSLWNLIAGFAYIVPIEERERVVNYVCKYVLKEGQVIVYRSSFNGKVQAGKYIKNKVSA